jgi:hypothetical protein
MPGLPAAVILPGIGTTRWQRHDRGALISTWPCLSGLDQDAGWRIIGPQQAVMAAVLASGGRVGVVRDADEKLGLLDAWDIPRARRLVLTARKVRIAGVA